nr:hypothetical protein [Tanacetum cinerariifolium]
MLKHILRGRLLASFQDHEHESGVTRSQGGVKDIVLKIKIQDHSMKKKFPRIRLQVSRKVHLNDHPLGGDAYKTSYAYATGEKTPKPEYAQKKADSETSPQKKPVQA